MSENQSQKSDFGKHHFSDASHHSNDAPHATTSSFSYNTAASDSSSTTDNRISAILQRHAIPVQSQHSSQTSTSSRTTISSALSCNVPTSHSKSSRNSYMTTSSLILSDGAPCMTTSSLILSDGAPCIRLPPPVPYIWFVTPANNIILESVASRSNSTELFMHNSQSIASPSSASISGCVTVDNRDHVSAVDSAVPQHLLADDNIPTNVLLPVHSFIRQVRTYCTYPEDDLWSVSSMESGSVSITDSVSTATTSDSTLTTTSNGIDVVDTNHYHNPRFLGCLHYYFPPRMQPMPNNRVPDHNVDSTIVINPSTAPYVPCITGQLSQESNQSSTFTAPSTISQHETISQMQLESAIYPVSVLPPSIPTDLSPDIQSHQLHQSTLEQCWDNFHSSSDNVRPNDHWGDTIDVKYNNTVRIYFQNVNSFGLSQGTSKINTILQSMQQMDCDILTFVQTSVNWRFLHLRNRLRMSVQRLFPKQKMNISRNQFRSEQPALPGGCAQIITGDWSGRVVEFIHDFRNMGRWCGMKLRLQGDRHLYLITAYRVCQQSSAHIGPETAYRQQELMLALDGIEYPDPRKQFIQDFTQCVKQWQSTTDDVLISMDVNEQLGDSAHGLTYMMRECRLIDIFHHHHGNYPAFETFDLGSKRLDYIIGSASLLPFTKRCGYLPFYQGIPSDHRGLYIDLSHELIDGITRLENTPTRHLHSAFQKDVYKYKQQVAKEFESHQINQRAQVLFDQSESGLALDDSFRSQLESIDTLILQIQLKAEAKCCKKRTKYDWSDEIHFTRQCVSYWMIQRKKKTRNRDPTKVCLNIYNMLPLEHQKFIDIATGGPKLNWTKTKLRLKNLMAHHRKTQAEMQNDLIDNEAKYTYTTNDKVQAKQDRIKKDKKLYNTLRHHFHPAQRSGITHLIVPDKDENNLPTDNVDMAKSWRMETQPQQVLDRLFKRNVSHFGQAEGTPFTVAPLLDQLGYDGMTSIGKSLIQEGKLPDILDEDQRHANIILQRLTEESDSHITLSDLITFEKFTKTIKKWSEATSTSPSGKHLGHYKSLTSIDSYSSKYTEEDPDPGPNILLVLYQIAASAFQSGINLPRWTKVTTCMIEKIPGQPRINKLRVIHLYEADYNAFNKMIWQRGIIWDAHIKGTLNTAQSGSRPNRTSIETVVSKGQKYMFSRLTRTSMATMDNDAKSCYDRIVATLALLTSHKFGVPATFCSTVGETLRTMQFSIRTAMGDSPQTYCHSSDTPIYGVGQGGTASPAFWLLVSSILFDCYQRQATGMVMRDPTRKITIQQWLEAIVDDTSLFTNLKEGDDVHTLVRTLERDAQEWEKFLSASGGCLELSKCFYYILSWSFDTKGDASPMPIEEVHRITSPVHLQEYAKPNLTMIASKQPQEAHKTLGVWKSMDGNVDEHVKVLTQRSKNLSNIVATSGLYPYQADVALRMIYTPAMTYSLPSVSIPQKVLDNIQYKAIEIFLPALGYNHGFPRAVVFGPKQYGGMGVPHLFTEMNVSKVEYIMMHIRSNSDIGIQFRINLNWLQINLGIPLPLFEYDHDITYFDDKTNWFLHLHSFLRNINARLVISNTYVPKMEREGDCCIMESIRLSNLVLSGKQTRHINNWRRYFRVQTLSDITNQFGDAIMPMYFTFDTEDHQFPRETKLDWPRQAKPKCMTTFKLWIRCIRVCFLQGRNNKLVKPLGKWIVSPSGSESVWQTYINPSYTMLIQQKDDSFRCYQSVIRTTSCTTQFSLSQFREIDSIPEDFFPVQATMDDTILIASHNKQRMLVHPSSVTIDQATDVEHAVQLSPAWKKHTLQHFHIYDPPMFSSIIQQPDTKLYIVSDGGLKDGQGSFGVSFGTDSEDIAMIEGPAPGNNDLNTSLRSEAYGLLAAIAFINVYVRAHSVVIPPKRPILLYSDNLGLVMWVQDLLKNVSYPRMYLRPEADVLMQIEHEIHLAKQSNFLLRIDWIKGHQDDHVTFNELSRPAQLNVRADQFSTHYLDNGADLPYDEFCNNPVNLYIGHDIINRIYNHLLRSASCSSAFRLYMLTKYLWHVNTPDLIWWQVHGKSLASLSPNDTRRVRKYIFSWLPTNERLHMFGESPTPNCPSCKAHELVESHQHLIQCPGLARVLIMEKWRQEMKDFLSISQYTPTIIKDIIINHLESVIYPITIPSPDTEYDSDVIRAMEAQAMIGWNHFFFGRLSIIWGSIIGRHLSLHRVNEKEMTIDRWGQTIIIIMFRLILNIWQQRNLDGHELTANNESSLSRQRILDKIQALQDSNPDVRHSDKVFVVCPMDTLQHYSIGNLMAWYRAAQSIIKAQKPSASQPSILAIFPTATSSVRPSNPDPPMPPPEPDPDPAGPLPPPVPDT